MITTTEVTVYNKSKPADRSSIVILGMDMGAAMEQVEESLPEGILGYGYAITAEAIPHSVLEAMALRGYTNEQHFRQFISRLG